MTDPDRRPDRQGYGTPLEDPSTPARAGSRGGLLQTAAGMIASPTVTLRRIADEQPVGQAVAVVVVITALLAVLQAVPLATEPAAAAQVTPAALVGGLLIGLPIALVSFVVWTGAVLLGARLLGGTGTFPATFCGLAFAYVPMVFSVVVYAIGLPFGRAAAVLVVPTLLAISLWSFVLDVLAVREAHSLTTGRAVGAVVLPVVAFFALAVLVVALLAAVLRTAG